MRRAKAMVRTRRRALVLKTFIAPTVRERRARRRARTHGGGVRAVSTRGGGRRCGGVSARRGCAEKGHRGEVRAAEEMRACAREAGVADEDVEPGFADFADAAETAKRAAVE